MRLATFRDKSDPRQPRIGALVGDRMLDLAQCAHKVAGGPALPGGSMKQLLELGADPASTTPGQFSEFIRRENTKWAKFIQEQGIVVEGQ